MQLREFKNEITNRIFCVEIFNIDNDKIVLNSLKKQDIKKMHLDDLIIFNIRNKPFLTARAVKYIKEIAKDKNLSIKVENNTIFF